MSANPSQFAGRVPVSPSHMLSSWSEKAREHGKRRESGTAQSSPLRSLFPPISRLYSSFLSSDFIVPHAPDCRILVTEAHSLIFEWYLAGSSRKLIRHHFIHHLFSITRWVISYDSLTFAHCLCLAQQICNNSPSPFSLTFIWSS